MGGIKKTALFLSGLEWKTVDLLLGRLEPEIARAVRREMMSVETVSAGETDRLADEFLREAGAGPRKSRRMIEHQIPTSGATYAPPKRSRFSASPFGTTDDSPVRLFDFLKRIEPEAIAAELSEEHPQTIAAVLAHLPAPHASQTLDFMSRAVQVDVRRRLANYETLEPTILAEIESELRQRLESRSNPDVEPRISFDDLERLGNQELSKLFHSVDTTTALLALIGAKPSLIERVTKRFSPTEEYKMRQELKRLGPIDDADVQRARATVLGKLKMEN